LYTIKLQTTSGAKYSHWFRSSNDSLVKFLQQMPDSVRTHTADTVSGCSCKLQKKNYR